MLHLTPLCRVWDSSDDRLCDIALGVFIQENLLGHPVDIKILCPREQRADTEGSFLFAMYKRVTRLGPTFLKSLCLIL